MRVSGHGPVGPNAGPHSGRTAEHLWAQWVRAGLCGDLAGTDRTPALRNPARCTAYGEDRQVVLLHPRGEVPYVVDE